MITTAKQSSILQGFPKYRSMLAGNNPYLPPVYDSIATASGDGTNLTITLSSIPQTYSHLQLRIMALATTNTGTAGYIRLNGDTTTSYAYHYLSGNSTTASVGGVVTATSIFTLINNTAGLSNTAPTVGVVDILDYTSSKNKTVRIFSGTDVNSGGDITIASGLWLKTTAINSITLYLGSGAFATTTRVALYGIKAA